MFFKPRWLKQISKTVPLSDKQIKELDKLRKELSSLSDEQFVFALSGSTEFGKMIIQRDYGDLKKLHPEATEKDILFNLLFHENETMKVAYNCDGLSEEEFTQIFSKLETLDDFINFVECLEKEEQPQYYSNPIGSRIEAILKQRR